MTVQTFYQCAVWMPLLLPALAAVVLHGTGTRLDESLLEEPLRMLLLSGIYGGVPYVLLAGWATWWIGERPEHVIRRLALRAPLYMLALWAVAAALFGVLAREVTIFLGLAALGGALSVAFGDAYVGLVFLLRTFAGRAGLLSSPSSQRGIAVS